jgi:5-methylcytosine-specific restriction endonuclease McrA
MTEEHREKISRTMKKRGIKPTEKARKANLEYLLGRKVPSEIKMKISKKLKGKKLTEEHRLKMVGKHNSPNTEFKRKKGMVYKRAEHPTNKKYISWRIGVFKRDNFTCQACEKIGGRLQAHHIQPWVGFKELRYEVNNGITLCVDCHKLTHKKNGKGWKENVKTSTKEE